jgi:hypothetical protein
LNGLYAVSLGVVAAVWIAPAVTTNPGRFVLRSVLFFAAAATILPFSLFPLTGGGSIVLLLTGHAYFMAGVAAAVFVLVLDTMEWR